jgi:hypothetical protein
MDKPGTRRFNDGALLVSEDASATIWRITYSGKAAQTR